MGQTNPGKGKERSRTPSYICTLELRVSKSVARRLEERFEMATVFYNDLLIESRQRLKMFKADPRVLQANKDLSAWHASRDTGVKQTTNQDPGSSNGTGKEIARDDLGLSCSARNLRAIIRGRGNLETDDGGLPGGSDYSVIPRASDFG